MNSKPIVFIESSRSLGGSLKSLLSIYEHLEQLYPCSLITNYRAFFEPLLHQKKGWKVLRLWRSAKLERGPLGILFDSFNILKYMALFLIAQPRLVYLNNDTYSNRHAAIAAMLMRIPYLFHVRGETYDSWLSRFLLKRSLLNIAISSYIKEQLDDRTGQVVKNVLILNGVDVSPPNITPEIQRHDVTPVAHIGNFTGWKGQCLLLEALVHYQKQFGSTLELHFFGSFEEDNEEYKNCKKVIEQHQLESVVNFHGMVNDIPKRVANMPIVVNASTSPEPFGRTIIEGMQLGKVVVAPDDGGPAEIIEHGSNGVLFRSNDPEALAQALNQAVALKEDATFLANSLERGREFSVNRTVKNIEYLLQRALPS